jgi:predicted glycogen debranching enzyme
LPSNTSKAELDDTVPVNIIVRPDIEDRSAHAKTEAHPELVRSWSQAVGAANNSFSFAPAPERQLWITSSGGSFVSEPEWTHGVPHPVDAQRGLGESSDLFSPGYFKFELQGTQTVTLKAEISTDRGGNSAGPRHMGADGEDADGERPLAEALRLAMRDFVVRRDELQTVIAGYPWFLDWGRDTLICLRGMIAAGAIDEAKSILVQFARLESRGTLPNAIYGDDASNRDTSDAPLWFFIACRDLFETEGGTNLLDADCKGRALREVLVSIAENYIAGTPNGISMDADSGLVFSPPHFTWMDTNHPAGTPRQGYPIEIQSLWYAALAFLSRVDNDAKWGALAELVRGSILKFFPVNSHSRFGDFSDVAVVNSNQCATFLSDCLHADFGQPACDAVADDHLRPNQLLAVTLGAVEERELCGSLLKSCEELLVPGAIRSLASRPVAYRLEIKHHGRSLNDPSRPYWGNYRGVEDTHRKPAYHNGTAWTWLFPSYCEAIYMTYGDGARDTALAILSSCTELMNRGCVGHVPEIVDGDTPHTLRGCGAQAWGAAELYRIHTVLAGADIA